MGEKRQRPQEQKEGKSWVRETMGDRRFQSCLLTLIVAPESLILGFLGVEVF